MYDDVSVSRTTAQAHPQALKLHIRSLMTAVVCSPEHPVHNMIAKSRGRLHHDSRMSYCQDFLETQATLVLNKGSLRKTSVGHPELKPEVQKT